MANEKADAGTAPYLTWEAFEGFLRGLAVLPPRIDATLMSGKSGTIVSQLRGALRFFGLVKGSNDEVTDRLRDLHASKDGEGWSAELAGALLASYARIVEGVDLDAGTLGDLQKAFRERGGLTGSAVDKAIRFYLTTLAKLGKGYSPHFPQVRAATSGPRPRAPRGSRPARRSRRGGAPASNGAPDHHPSPPDGTKELVFQVPSGKNVKVWWPVGLTEKEEAYVLQSLNGYLSLQREAAMDG